MNPGEDWISAGFPGRIFQTAINDGIGKAGF